jgi:hypothetical protein
MGRSVSTHQYAVATVFLHDVAEQDDWESFVEDLQNNVIPERYPSFIKCDRWSGREDHVIMENSRAEISVSEYCGCVAICLAPLRPGEPLDDGWCARVASAFERHITKMFNHCAMVPLGTFSNGETVFQSVNS